MCAYFGTGGSDPNSPKHLYIMEPSTDVPFYTSVAPTSRSNLSRYLRYCLHMTQLRTGCEETIEATVRKRRLCFAGSVMRMEDNRLPKRVLLGTLATGKGYRGGQESDWVSHLGEDLVAFGMKEEKEGARRQTSALKQEEWFGKIEDGVVRFMRKWHTREAEASAKRKLARAEGTPAAKAAEVAGENPPPRGRRGKETGVRRRLSESPAWRRRRRKRETGRQR